MSLPLDEDRTEALLGRVYDQYRGSNWAEPLARALGEAGQRWRAAAVAVLSAASIDPVTEDAASPLYGVGRGVQLDRLGRIVGQARGSCDDAAYRAILRARLRASRSAGGPDDLIAVLVAMFPGATVRLDEAGTAQVRLALDAPAVDPVTAALAAELLRAAKAAGVRVLLEYACAPAAGSFAFAGGDGLGFDSVDPVTGALAGSGGALAGVAPA